MIESMQFSDDYLELIAPRLPRLTECGAPEIPPLPPYVQFLALREVLGELRVVNERTRTLICGFLVRGQNAVREYRDGRDRLQTFVTALPQHNEIQALSRSISHFETCLIQTTVAVQLLHKAFRVSVPGWTPGVATVYHVVRRMNNRVKHFDEDVANDASPPVAPLWITNKGLECNERGTEIALAFSDLAELLLGLSHVAKLFGEGKYGPRALASEQ